MNHSLRVLALAGLAVVSVAAHAATFVFDFSSKGAFALAAGSYSVNDSVLVGAGSDNSTLPVSTVSYSYLNSALTTGSGTITLADSSTIDFAFGGSLTSSNPNSKALNGTVLSFSNGTGSLANMVGSGSISNTLRWAWNAPGTVGTSRTTYYAELEAVPEPASMAALAMGVIAAARKRRK